MLLCLLFLCPTGQRGVGLNQETATHTTQLRKIQIKRGKNRGRGFLSASSCFSLLCLPRGWMIPLYIHILFRQICPFPKIHADPPSATAPYQVSRPQDVPAPRALSPDISCSFGEASIRGTAQPVWSTLANETGPGDGTPVTRRKI